MHRSQKLSLTVLLTIVCAIGVSMWWVGSSVVLTTRDEVPEVSWGADVRSASTAGSLALNRDAVALYDKDDDAYQDINATRYIYPPWYAVLMIPLSLIPSPAVYFVWWAIGVVLLVGSVRLLEISAPNLVSVVALATWAALACLWYGQSSFLLLAVLALGLRLSLAGRNVSAGIAMALCAFKPHLLLGFVVLWLADVKKWRTLLISAAGTTVILAAASELWIPGAWGQFLGTVFATGVLLVPEREVSLLTAINLLLPNAGSLGWAIWGLAVAAIVGSFLATIRRWQGNARGPAALAILVSLLLSLHGLSYDWVLLVAAFGLLARHSGISEYHAAMPFLLLAALLPIGFLATDAMLDRFGWAIHSPPLLLLAVYAWFVVAMTRSPESRASVLADVS